MDERLQFIQDASDRITMSGFRAGTVSADGSVTRKVKTAGTFRLQHMLQYVANALVDQHIGLKETDDGVWSIYFNTVLLATVDERDYIIRV